MNKITINGVTVVSGRSMKIANGRVIVDGKDVTGDDAKNINIEIHGDLYELSADVCNSINVTGSTSSIKTMSGDVHCANVTGSVKTMSGTVMCGDVGGNVNTMSGNVTSQYVKTSV